MDLLKVHLHCERSTVSFHLIEYFILDADNMDI